MIDPHLLDHISDPKIKELYKFISWDDYRVYQEGNKLVEETGDKLAVYSAIKQSIENIILDLEEHGRANADMYDNHDKSFFENELKRIENEIAALKASGAESEVFPEYDRKYNEEISKQADEFVAQMDKAEISKMANNITNNSIVEALKAGDIETTQKIVDDYIHNAKPEIYEEGVSEELAGNMIAAGDHAKKPEYIKFALEKLVPRDMHSVENPRLAFNIACGYALLGDKEKMLEAIKKARTLGKRIEEFEAEVLW